MKCLNVGLVCAYQCFLCSTTHQNLSLVDWCDKIYFYFDVQIISDVLAVLGTNVLKQPLPWCSHIISRSLVAIIEDVFAKVCTDTFLGCAFCAVSGVSLSVSVSASASTSGVAAAFVYSLTDHCRMRINISCRSYDRNYSEALLFVRFSC